MACFQSHSESLTLESWKKWVSRWVQNQGLQQRPTRARLESNTPSKQTDSFPISGILAGKPYLWIMSIVCSSWFNIYLLGGKKWLLNKNDVSSSRKHKLQEFVTTRNNYHGSSELVVWGVVQVNSGHNILSVKVTRLEQSSAEIWRRSLLYWPPDLHSNS